MKKTFPVNIHNTVFYIDEDAYDLLSNYLDQLHKAFPGQEGTEIIADIEARICEIFLAEHPEGNPIITIADVSTVIEQMGTPRDMGAEPLDENDSPAADSAETSDSPGDVPPPFTADDTAHTAPGRKLFRNESNKVIAGVLSGIACYLGWNANILRLLYLILTLCTYWFPGVVCYLIAWMIIPPARTRRDYLEMMGEPVTINNIGRTFLNDNIKAGANTVNHVFSFVARALMLILGVVCACAGIGFMIYLGLRLWGVASYTLLGDTVILHDFSLMRYRSPSLLEATGCICGCVALILIVIAALRGISAMVFGTRRPSRSTNITMAIVIAILFVLAAIFLFVSQANAMNHYHALYTSAVPVIGILTAA